jgi:cell division protein ZapE
MTPLERYQQDLKRDDFTHDKAQEAAVLQIQRLYDDLVAARYRPRFSGGLSLVRRITDWGGQRPVKGLYLWGGVGRGKTFLMNTFFHNLPFDNKLRIHFHHFMQKVHRELNALREKQDPLQLVAGKFSEQTRVLCFDEFHVGDITDAMLLGGLLKALFERGVTLVATSNEAPDRLYWGGLQRERFLPAIELIKEHTLVWNVDGDVDYRLRSLEKAEIYHCPLDEGAEQSLARSFGNLASNKGISDGSIEIDGRYISALRHTDGVAWFDFEEICGKPLGPSDYIELALRYHTLLISNIPIMSDKDNDKAKRLMTLVDTIYDHSVKLIASANAVPAGLYTGSQLAQPFKRTASRLEEMQSHDYLAKQHLP